MRFLSLYIVFVSFSLVLLLSGGVHGIPVSVSNPNASPRHAEVHRRDVGLVTVVSGLLGLVKDILGSLDLPPVSAVLPAQAVIESLAASLPIHSLPVPRGAVETVGVGSSYSTSSTVQASSTASPSKVSSSPPQASSAAASASAAHQQADVHSGRGRHIHGRDTTSASPSSASGLAPSSTIASGSVLASSAGASGKPALAVVTPPISPPSASLPVPTPLPVSVPNSIPSLPVSPPTSILSLPVPPPTPIPSPPVSPPVSIPVLAASGMPTASGTTKGKRTRRNTHHR